MIIGDPFSFEIKSYIYNFRLVTHSVLVTLLIGLAFHMGSGA